MSIIFFPSKKTNGQMMNSLMHLQEELDFIKNQLQDAYSELEQLSLENARLQRLLNEKKDKTE